MSKPAKTRHKKTRSSGAAAPQPKSRQPRILVLEGAAGAAARAVRASGATALRVDPRNLQKVDEALAHGFDGLLLTGGGDLDPRLYGEKPNKQVYGVSETRDYAEWITLDRAKELHVPVMGICRGMQMIAVHNGGALKQHVTGHRGGTHMVWGERGSAFRRAIGHQTGSFPSLHHQIVRRHGGKGMAVGARSREGYIEAIESKRVLAVQFHPEYDYGTNEASRRLFDWLAREAARYAHLKRPTRARLEIPRHGLLGGGQQSFGFTRSAAPKPKAKPRPLATAWVCRDCGLRFDKERDRDDHEVWVCGDGQRITSEPPPGHPDWDDDVERMDRELDAIVRSARRS